MGRFDLATTTVGQLLDDPDAVAVVERHYPGITGQPMVKMMRPVLARKALGMASGYVGDDELGAIRAELERI
ncbi:MAG: hypothetical protein Q4F65_08205 [Propionibacteriaceae bacterium]|nr:hypothetical protein [Propionibacteriaceae bacterium]